ncbi:uncharacterized protein LOC129231579 [Uloborus diversus]|uniref:uncharacterized protein LOC129231579 n=1 Tax=Uloborus diversus TaxID=327109 RepID=UPI00240A1E9F|nr:uncharacterized protein LOC129231579 [Uloborus diversus]
MKLQEFAVLFLLIICTKIKICRLQGLAVVSEITHLSSKDGDKHSDEDDQLVPVVHVKDAPSSNENYSSIHGIAKKVSHSRGIFIDKNPNEPSEGVKLRRSISRKLAISSYSDVVQDLLHSFQEDTSNKLSILKQIEYLVHEYDVAVHFAKIGGIKAVLPYLLSSEEELVSAAALLLGTALQSNREVQKHAVDQKVGGSLLECLKSKKNNTFSHILFALSAYLRNMPEAQESFYQNDGIINFTSLLRSSTVAIKAKMRIVDLLHDLSIEHQISESDVSSQDFQRLQNLKVILENQIKRSKICEEVPHLLKINNYEVHQKVIAAMRAVRPICHQVFKDTEILRTIQHLFSYYTGELVELSNSQTVSTIPVDDDLKQSLSGEIKLLLNDISEFEKSEINKKEEL